MKRKILSRQLQAARDILRILLGRKPDFLIIGAQKSGTTSLFFYLKQHPQITTSFRKEIHFFDRFYKKGTAWYLRQFPLRKKWQKDDVIGEATPIYMFDLRSPVRIRKVLPNARLIVLLRNPIERAISQYFYEIRRTDPRIEYLPLMEALQAEEGRLDPEKIKIENDPYYISNIYNRMSYKARGRYYEQLLRFDKYIREGKMLILNSEEFYAKPAEIVRKTLNFLGIDTANNNIDFAPQNKGINRIDVPVNIYEYLNDYFRPFNQKLFEYLGQQFDW